MATKLAPDFDPLVARLEALAEDKREHDIADNLLFTRADVAEKMGDPETAVAFYDRLVERYRRSPLRDDALMRAAGLLRSARDFSGALKRLQVILDSRREALVTGSYNSIYLDDAQLLVGQIALRDVHDVARAIDAFSTLANHYPESILRDDALLFWAEALLQQHAPPTYGDQRAACKQLLRLFAQYPDSNQLREGRELAGRIRCSP